MKKTLAVTVCLLCLSVFFSACQPTQQEIEIDVTRKPSSSPSVSPFYEPSDSALPVTEPPTPSPTPTVRPAQTVSIVPAALLTAGYTTPAEDVPQGYRMPYYIEADLNNQCVNIFIQNSETGKYDVLLNRFVCSSGSSTMPSPVGKFYIKTQEQQKAATGQNLKYRRYYFQKYASYAYYVTRYQNEYMFHSYTFYNDNGKVVPKKSGYYNMGNTGSAGCIRLLMNHAKWIYDNIDGGTYCVVTKAHPVDSSLRSLLKKYIPPLGWDMLADYVPGKTSQGVARTELIETPDIVPTPVPTAEPSPTPEITPTPDVTPTANATDDPVETPTATTGGDPEVTPTDPGETPPSQTNEP